MNENVPASLQSKRMVQKPNMVAVRLGNYKGKSCMFTKTENVCLWVKKQKKTALYYDGHLGEGSPQNNLA